jgi:hypothetical protein
MNDERSERKQSRSRRDGRLFKRGGVWWLASSSTTSGAAGHATTDGRASPRT